MALRYPRCAVPKKSGNIHNNHQNGRIIFYETLLFDFKLIENVFNDNYQNCLDIECKENHN